MMGKVPKRDHMEIRMDMYRDLYGEFYTPKDL